MVNVEDILRPRRFEWKLWAADHFGDVEDHGIIQADDIGEAIGKLEERGWEFVQLVACGGAVSSSSSSAYGFQVSGGGTTIKALMRRPR